MSLLLPPLGMLQLHLLLLLPPPLLQLTDAACYCL
jgi:hypothetical protein